MKKILITGSAGFIGFHLSRQLLTQGNSILGMDSLNNYYDPKLKLKRNEKLNKFQNYEFEKVDLKDFDLLEKIYRKFKPSIVIHLAAQAGVRYSMENPKAYFDSNLQGTFNLLEIIKNGGCNHLLFGSTSSVYGGNMETPYKETDRADFPLSFYAATKKSCELMTHSYSLLYNIPTTCFRFFTVYGPWGRPDMAIFKFTEAILKSKAIEVYNNGDLVRDFTYIDDLINAIEKLLEKVPDAKKSEKEVEQNKSPVAPWRVVNIGSSKPIKLMDFIAAIEKAIGKKAKKNFVGHQLGDAEKTYADSSLLRNLTGHQSFSNLERGVEAFVKWYKSYYSENI